MNVEIVATHSHYEVYVDGTFFGSAETLSEAKQDIEDYINAQRETNCAER